MENNYTEQGQELMKEMVMGVTYVDAYLRYSSAAQNDGVSIEMQMDDINEYCAKNNLMVKKWYIDRAVSASKKEAETRDAFFELIQDIKAGISAGALMVYSTSRAFRNSYESHKYRKFLRDHKIKLMSATQHIDEDSSSGRLTTSILSDIDQYKSEELSDFVKSAVRALVKRGFYIGTAVPLGYITVPAVDEMGKPRKKYAIDENTAPIVQDIFRRYIEGQTPREIANWMTSLGIVTKRGNNYSPNTILKILKNDFYIGTRRLSLKDQEELVIEDAVDPIIDKSVFASAQQHRKSRANSNVPKSKWRKKNYMLTGKIICSECARRGEEKYMTGKSTTMYYNNRTQKRVYNKYVCQNKKKYRKCNCKDIRKEALEQYVLEQIKNHILTESKMDSIADEVLNAYNAMPKSKNDKNTLLSRKKELLAELVNLAKMKAKKEVDEEVYNILKKEYDDEKAQIDLELYQIEQEQKNAVTRESIKETILSMIADIETGNDEIIKTVFDRVVDRVEVDNDEVVVYLVISFAPYAHKASLGLRKYSICANIKRKEMK